MDVPAGLFNGLHEFPAFADTFSLCQMFSLYHLTSTPRFPFLPDQTAAWGLLRDSVLKGLLFRQHAQSRRVLFWRGGGGGVGGSTHQGTGWWDNGLSTSRSEGFIFYHWVANEYSKRPYVCRGTCVSAQMSLLACVHRQHL